MRPPTVAGWRQSRLRDRRHQRRAGRAPVAHSCHTPRLPARALSGAAARTKKKTGQASSTLSRFRDSLPSRHRRCARQRASGFIASEFSSNLHPMGRVARSRCYGEVLTQPETFTHVWDGTIPCPLLGISVPSGPHRPNLSRTRAVPALRGKQDGVSSRFRSTVSFRAKFAHLSGDRVEAHRRLRHP